MQLKVAFSPNRILLDGCLPLFRVDLTDEVLKSLFELVSNMPFPEPDQRLTTPEKPEEVLKVGESFCVSKTESHFLLPPCELHGIR